MRPSGIAAAPAGPAYRTRWRPVVVWLTVWVGFASSVSCVSSDDVPGGKRVEHPDPSAQPPPPTTSSVPSSAQAPETPTPAVHPPPLAAVDEPPSGFTRSQLDEAIA